MKGTQLSPIFKNTFRVGRCSQATVLCLHLHSHACGAGNIHVHLRVQNPLYLGHAGACENEAKWRSKWGQNRSKYKIMPKLLPNLSRARKKTSWFNVPRPFLSILERFGGSKNIEKSLKTASGRGSHCISCFDHLFDWFLKQKWVKHRLQNWWFVDSKWVSTGEAENLEIWW